MKPWTNGERGDTLLLALVAWLCSLPLVFLLAVPFLGWGDAAVLALAWLAVVAAACLALCLRRRTRDRTSPQSRDRGFPVVRERARR